MSNEQRAHDLALFMLSDALKPTKQDFKNSRISKPDVYSTYKKLYTELLEKINADF